MVKGYKKQIIMGQAGVKKSFVNFIYVSIDKSLLNFLLNIYDVI